MKKKIIITIILIIIILIIWRQCNNEEVPLVETTKVERKTIISTIVESGTVKPKFEVPVSPDVSGEIVELYVKEGDFVKQGDLLLIIKPDDYQAAYEEALANLNIAKAQYENAKANLLQAKHKFLQDSVNYERNKKLYQQNAISKQEYEQARLQYYLSQAQLKAAKQAQRSAYFQVINAKAMLKRAKSNLNKTKVFASQSGTITKLQVEKGQRVVGTAQMQGTEMMKISNMKNMIIEIEVNENDVIKLRPGNKAKIEFDAFPGKTFQGVVYEIAYAPKSNMDNTSSEQVTTYPVKIEILRDSYMKDKELMKNIPEHSSPFRTGMTGLVTIYTDTVKNTLAIPLKALILNPENQKEAVFKLIPDSNKVQITNIITGIDDAEFIQVKKGLNENDIIVSGPYDIITKKLKNGDKVKIINKKEK